MLSSTEIKKQIIAASDISGIRKRVENTLDEGKEHDLIEQADALERLTGEKGWVYLEAYMMRIIMDCLLKDEQKDLAKGMINVMQYVSQIIKIRDNIFERREKEGKNGVA